MSALWIEYDSSDDSAGARWGSPVTDEQIDAIIAYAVAVIGREPDTIA